MIPIFYIKEAGAKGLLPLSPAPQIPADPASASLRTISLDDSEHLLHNHHASVASLRLLFTFAPECRSPSLRNRCSPSPEYPTSLGTRISTNNLLNRHMLPALNRCRHCGLNDGKKHLEQNHRYEGDERLPRWHGWHAARRGLGTNLYRLGVPDKVIQAILRHSNVNVTLGYYIKPQTPDVVAAMGRFEAEIAAHDFGDTNRTLNRTSGAMPESVN